MAKGNNVDVLAEKDAEIAKLKAQLAAKAAAGPGISMKVSEKGAVSIYGLGRFPVTLYGEQWKSLLGKAEDILAFIDENAESLKTKADRAKK